MQAFEYDKLRVRRFDDRLMSGEAAGVWGAGKINELLKTKETVNVLFGAAPSQNEMLNALASAQIDFSRVHALHMDEYIGLEIDAQQSFGHYMDRHLFKLLPFASVHYINSGGDGDAMCEHYRRVLQDYPLDIVFLGIGENGHIAFNDPHVADFNDPQTVKIVALDEVCRQQQVNDGCFAAIEKVPKEAVTLTIPAIMAAGTLVCTVPAASKANAVEKTCKGPINVICPASIMRTHDDCVLFCDRDSGKYLGESI